MTRPAAVGNLNDLWEYSPSSGQWTWVSGGKRSQCHRGLRHRRAPSRPSNVPGARQAASSWIDSSGNLWLFGGAGYGSTGVGYLNDLWQFTPAQ